MPAEDQIVILSDADKKDIAGIIVAELKQQNSCACGLSTEAQGEVSHFMGMVKDTGGGNYATGVEAIRENQKFLSKIRSRSEKIATRVIMTATLAFLGGLGYLVYDGAKRWIDRCVGGG